MTVGRGPNGPLLPIAAKSNFRVFSMLLLSVLLGVATAGAEDSEVYLRSLTIHKTHEKGWNGRKPEVYVACDDDGRDDIDLHEVKHTETPYKWGPVDKAITHLGTGQCRRCRLRERDTFDPDDTFGELRLCFANFSRPEGIYEAAVAGEFDAKFQCLGCVAPDEPTVSASTFASAGGANSSSAASESSQSSHSHSHREIGVQVSSNDSATSSSSSASAPGIELSATATTASAGGPSTELAGAAPAHSARHHEAKVGSAIAAGLLCVMVGVVAGIVAYRLHQAQKHRREEERMRELDAILGDPTVDFEQMAAQDGKALGWNFSRLWRTGQQMWTRVPEKAEMSP
ncbi:unnamed protein product [Ostreobium quekettii]|uniref:DUF7953 domain-containing protein n=1 Tax=Ostreobium quekettii TaxID=121088 RepID=A0A8S1J200_9CHLO|nr:unnamed protein product [Ostreobium quekettii]|eukprot:evm.model.scf_55.6 EVM.evm.TU.scf_55.6   scf_55:129396-130424(-)